MKKILLILCLITNPVYASGQIDFGGKLDDGDLSITTSVDYTWPAGKFERDIEFDYRYKDEDDIRSTSKGLIEFKQRYEFHNKHYTFGLARYDYNEFRPINSRLQSSIGWGYKILRTERFKMSNEFAIGALHTDIGNEVLFRNSLWFFYEVAPKLNFSNKFLYEAADEPLIRNETSFDYLLTDKIKIGLKNIYTEDPRNDNILYFNVGYIF
jgi:putative salt-induced outer membrane protein YdiY|tara:strand:+ start:771 stop:1403 length:633 start_codon:yes stop_codon:yes gene_type:complete